MPSLPDSDNSGRAVALAQENIPDVAPEPDRAVRKARNGVGSRASKEGIGETQECNEAESVILEMRSKDMIRPNPDSTYCLSPILARRIIQNADTMKTRLRVCIYRAIWSYYDYANAAEVKDSISCATDVVESMLWDD